MIDNIIPHRHRILALAGAMLFLTGIFVMNDETGSLLKGLGMSLVVISNLVLLLQNYYQKNNESTAK